MTPERRQRLLLIGLFAALTLVVLFRVGPLLRFGGEGGAGLGSTTGGGADVTRESIVELARLEPDVRSYQVERDPFRFGQAPRPPAPPPPKPRPEQSRPTPPPPPPPEPQGPVLPTLELTYLGKFGPSERPIAVLTDGDEIINARVGDEVDDHFRVKSINFESVDLEYLDFPDAPIQRLPVGS